MAAITSHRSIAQLLGLFDQVNSLGLNIASMRSLIRIAGRYLIRGNAHFEGGLASIDFEHPTSGQSRIVNELSLRGYVEILKDTGKKYDNLRITAEGLKVLSSLAEIVGLQIDIENSLEVDYIAPPKQLAWDLETCTLIITGRSVSEDMREWLDENAEGSSVKLMGNTITIKFDDIGDAALFKLRWL